MAYPGTGSHLSTQTPDERRAEADRIIQILFESIEFEDMTLKEQEFVGQMQDEKAAVSPKQLLWLRDIKSRYAE